MNPLPDIARATSAEHAMLSPGTPVVVMVSGGADSMALLHLFAAGLLGDDLTVRVVHVNHLLRGEDSDADEAFVVAECGRLGVACRAVRVDVAGHAAAHGLNLEDAGREERYRIAATEADELAGAVGAPAPSARIAVAHTLDDRIETLCMRLMSGAGAAGLASIRHVRGRIVRPLLDCGRPQVREWLTSRGGTWREDVTNTDTTRLRAHIRHELLPVLEAIEPAFRTTLARSMRVLAEEDELLGGMAEAFARDFATDEAHRGEVSLDRSKVRTLSRPMRRRVVRAALRAAFPHASRIDSDHVEAIVSGFDDESFARDLPHDLRAFAEYGRMVVTYRGERLPAVAPCLLTIPGTADLGRSGVVTATESSPARADSGPYEVVVDLGQTTELSVTGVRAGDRMRPLGMEGTKKLSDILIDAKVAQRVRDRLPVVRDGDAIVWVPGVRMSDDYRLDASTQRAVRLVWRPEAALPGHDSETT